MKASLDEIITRQKKEAEAQLERRYIPRRVIAPGMENNLIKVIIGPRRCGKSVYALHLVATGAPYGYANFDDETLAGADNYDRIIESIARQYNSPRLLFFDEIQNLPRWELFVNRLQRQGYNLVLTGSNAHLLSTELSTHLTGRHLSITLFPFSFTEYLEAVPQTVEASLEMLAYRYVNDGGYPEPIMSTIDKKDYLRTLFQAILYKDIIRRHRIGASGAALEETGRYLLSNTGSEYSYRTLAGIIGTKSDKTARKYVSFLEESFLLFSVPRFSFKIREQAAANKKIFALDNGFIHAVGFAASPGTGKLAENAAAILLKRREIQGEIGLYFWKSAQHEEVDFVIYKDRKVDQLIQVCWNMADPKTRQREIRSLLKAGKELRCTNLRIITENEEGTEKIEWFGNQGTITIVPLWKWLKDQE